MLPSRRDPFHNLALSLAKCNPAKAHLHPQPFQRLHPSRVLPQYRLGISTISLINTSARRPS